MGFDTKVHHYAKVPGQRIAHLQKVTPYAYLNNGEKDEEVPKVLLRGGKCWGMNGKEITPAPQWVIEKIKDMNSKVLEELGWANKLQAVEEKPKPTRKRRRAAKKDEVENDGDSSTNRRMDR